MMINLTRQAVTCLVYSLAVLTSCAATLQTPGERFRQTLKEIEANCNSRTLEPNEVCGEITRLNPADPLATPEGRFAHSIKIPNPVREDGSYKPGMTPQEYFEHLCKTEAGEFIFKTVENVEGIYQMRPREETTDNYLQHLYALEDPYGATKHPEEYFIQPAIGKYQFLEVLITQDVGSHANGKYLRYYRDEKAHPGREYQTAINGRAVRVPYIVAQQNVSTLQSRYGYTWRGITRPHDREMGIAGAELIVLDLETKEVLAVRRDFVRSGDGRYMTGVWWLTSQKCSKGGIKPQHQFIYEVLKPLTSTMLEKSHDAK